MIDNPQDAYAKATRALAQAAGFRFEASFENTPARKYEATGSVSRGQAIQLTGAVAGGPSETWKVFRMSKTTYRGYQLIDGAWARYRAPDGAHTVEAFRDPMLLEGAVWLMEAHSTLTRPRVRAGLSNDGLPAEIDGQACMRFTADLSEGAFYWVTFYLATGHFARHTRSGHGGGWMVTLLDVGEPVEISDPARG